MGFTVLPVGILRTILWAGTAEPTRQATVDQVAYASGISTPFSDQGSLQSVVWADVFGSEWSPMTRETAMAVPAIAMGRHRLAPTIGRLPLRAMRGDAVIPSPYWMTRTDTTISPFHRMLWTVDDLIFHPFSLWVRANGTDGFPVACMRIPPHRWDFDEVGRVRVDGEYVADDQVILIPGPHEGILSFGAEAIRHAADLMRAAGNAARNPQAHTELHQTGGPPMTAAERREFVAEWAAARRGENGGVAFTSQNLEVRDHGSYEGAFLDAARNTAAVECARIMGLNASTVDATAANASLTYETREGRNLEFVDYGLAMYASAITARLSMDDVVPAGTRVAFDLEDYAGPTPSPTGPTLED